MFSLYTSLQRLLDSTRAVDFLAPLALRLYLAPIFWMAGTGKLADMDSTIAWFGNPDWGLGLPFPIVLAWAAALTETLGAVLLLIGLAVRWVSLPLMITMLVAIFTVHWQQAGKPSPTPNSACSIARMRKPLPSACNRRARCWKNTAIMRG